MTSQNNPPLHNAGARLALITRALDSLPPDFRPSTVLDIAAGCGDFGAAFRRLYGWHASLTAFEQSRAYVLQIAYNYWHVQSFLSATIREPVDLVMGSIPPGRDFGLWIAKARACVAPGGYAVYIQGGQIVVWNNCVEVVQ